MKDNTLHKLGTYMVPLVKTITLQGGPCMQNASPNGSLQNLEVNGILNEGDF